MKRHAMRKLSVLSLFLFACLVVAGGSYAALSAMHPVGCAATLNSSTEPPSLSIDMNISGGVTCDVNFAINCDGDGTLPCNVCATFQFYYQPHQNSGWYAFGGVECAGNENGSIACNSDNVACYIVADVASPPVSYNNAYKCTVTIYPTTCDQLETYGGPALWSGSVSG